MIHVIPLELSILDIIHIGDIINQLKRGRLKSKLNKTMTNIINIKKSIGVLSIAVLALGVSLSTFATVVHADDGGGYDFSPDSSSGSGYDYAPDYSAVYDFAPYSSASGYDFAPDYSSGYDFAPDTSSCYDFAPDYSSSGGGYSSGGSYGYNYATPTYYSSTPSYSSYAYSTPGLGSGYSSNIYTTPGTGYSTSGKTQTPIVYNTPTQTQVQTQTASGQPIVINNNNNNTNTNTNTNSAPVTQIASTPAQQIIDYVYPTTPTYSTYRTPVVATAIPSVSLSQIPYTGFDFGPVGDAVYWAGLLSFAVAAAYLLVYYRGGAFSFATALISGRGGRSNFRPVQFTDEVEVAETTVEKPVVEHVPAANARVASVLSNLPIAETRHVTSDAMIVSHSKNGEMPRIVITRE